QTCALPIYGFQIVERQADGAVGRAIRGRDRSAVDENDAVGAGVELYRAVEAGTCHLWFEFFGDVLDAHEVSRCSLIPMASPCLNGAAKQSLQRKRAPAVRAVMLLLAGSRPRLWFATATPGACHCS